MGPLTYRNNLRYRPSFQAITQFELEDPELGNSATGALPSALGWITSLRNLRACSLPACIPPPPVTNRSGASGINSALGGGGGGISSPQSSLSIPCRLVNRSLVSLRHLQRLSLTRCYLQGQLHILLGGLSQPMEYVNLQVRKLNVEKLHK